MDESREAIRSLNGYFLIAAPTLLDPNFVRSVILIIQHGSQGAMGVILNRPLKRTIGEAWQQVAELPIDNAQPLHEGGPCPGPLIAIHQLPTFNELQILSDVAVAISSESVAALVRQNTQPAKFVFGNAGWAGGQLEAEINDGAWLLLPATPESVFAPAEGLWLKLTREASRRATAPGIPDFIVPTDPHLN